MIYLQYEAEVNMHKAQLKSTISFTDCIINLLQYTNTTNPINMSKCIARKLCF